MGLLKQDFEWDETFSGMWIQENNILCEFCEYLVNTIFSTIKHLLVSNISCSLLSNYHYSLSTSNKKYSHKWTCANCYSVPRCIIMFFNVLPFSFSWSIFRIGRKWTRRLVFVSCQISKDPYSYDAGSLLNIHSYI